MAELDEATRYALKLAPTEHLAWLLPRLDTDLEWRRWLDTETIAFPGEPKRRCDTVAELVSRKGTQLPWKPKPGRALRCWTGCWSINCG
jgi:hypothetical protein